MSKRDDIDRILRKWPYEPGEVSVRRTEAGDGREVLQTRVELGVLQLELANRPDGERPGGADTYLDYLVDQCFHAGKDFQLSEEQCLEVDREFIQFYHRRVCWLSLREFDRAVSDADHTLALMDFVKAHSPSEEWTLSHEQYRPFVLFHRTQASALHAIESSGPDSAIGEIDAGLDRLRDFFADYELEERFEDDDMVERLEELKKSLRDKFEVGETLAEQLADAVAAEQYERAATLRDEIARREIARRQQKS